MAVVADRVIVELEAKLDRYDANVRKAEQTFARATGGIEKNAGLVTKATGAMGAALGGLSAAVAAREFLRLADASKSVEAQLKLATRAFGTYGQAQADVERISAETRSGLVETSSLYASFARAAQTSGKSQAEAARASETFNKALLIGGAGQAQAASATLQLGQALGSVTPQWEELGQVFEASPRIQKLIADSLGVTSGALKQLVSDGKLSSAQLFDAFANVKFTGSIDDEFKTLPITFSQAMQAVENAATITIGAFDRGGEFSTAIANFFTDGATGFSSLSDSAEQFGADTRAVLAGLANVFDPLEVSGNAVFDALGIKIFSVSEQIRSLLGSFDRVSAFAAAGANFINAPGNAIRRAQGQATTTVTGSDLAGDFDRGQRRSSARSRREASARRLEGQGFIVPRNADGTVNEAGIRRRPTAPTPPKPAAAGSGAKPKKGPKGPSAETLANRAEAAAQKGLRNDESYEQEKAALNRDLLRARRATVTAADQIAAFELQEIEAARLRQNAAYDSEVSQKKLTEARAAELKAINNSVAAEQAKAVRLAETERKAREAVALAQGDLDNQTDLLDAQGALTDSIGERRDVSLRLLDLAKQEEKLRLDAILASTQASETEKEIARRRLAVLDELYGAKKAGIEQDAEGPLARRSRELEKSPEDLRRDAEQIVVDQLDEVQDGITNALASKLGTKNKAITAILDLFVQQVIMKPITEALSGAGKGKGGGGFFGTLLGNIGGAAASGSVPFGKSSVGSFLGGLFGGKRASGGHVNAGRIYEINDGGGTEGFQPSGSGKIIPLGQMNRAGGGGGTSLSLSVAVDNRGSVNPDGFADEIAARVRKETVGIVTTAVKSVNKGVPSRVAQFQRDGI